MTALLKERDEINVSARMLQEIMCVSSLKEVYTAELEGRGVDESNSGALRVVRTKLGWQLPEPRVGRRTGSVCVCERRGRCRTRAEQHIVQSNSSKTDVFFSLVIRVLVLAISNTRAVLEDAARPRAQYSAESPRVGPPQVCAGSVGSAEKIQIRGI